jgi:hypothetical protein
MMKRTLLIILLFGLYGSVHAQAVRTRTMAVTKCTGRNGEDSRHTEEAQSSRSRLRKRADVGGIRRAGCSYRSVAPVG